MCRRHCSSKRTDKLFPYTTLCRAMRQCSVEGLMAKQSINETCATCHRDIRQQCNRRSHMPLPEGQMACVDCHNPHGTINVALLKTDTVNETCYQCHAE